MSGNDLIGMVGPTSPRESSDDEVVSHIRHEGLEVSGKGLNKLVAAQLPNLALWPNIWPFVKMGHH